MADFLRDKKQFIITCFIWILAGMVFRPLAYTIVPITVLMLYSKKMHEDILIGFLFILTISDSRLESLRWAANAKNIYIVLLTFFAAREYGRLNYKINFTKFFIPFFAIAFFCIIYSPNPGTSFQKTLSYLFLFFSVPTYFMLVFQQNGTVFIRNLTWFFATLLSVGILMFYISPAAGSLVGRFRGVLGNPNGLGIYCLLFLILFTFVTERYPEMFTRRQKLFIYFVAGFSLIKCGARSSLMALLLFLFFKRFYKVSPVLGFLVFLVSIVAYEYISLNLDSIVLSLGLEEYLRLDTLKDASGRLVAWEFGWQHVQKNFYIGKGFFYTEFLYIDNYLYLSSLGHQGTAHNSYLTFWLDTGLVGLVAFLAGLFTLFYKAAKLTRMATPLLYAILFSNQFESWLTASLNPFTIVFLFILSIIFVPEIIPVSEEIPEEVPNQLVANENG